jgi:hypothetical protein
MVEFNYTLYEHGWASLLARIEGAEFEFRVSYMSNAVEDFVSSVVTLLSGEAVVRFALIDEPGEHCWTLKRGDGRLSVTVVHLKGMYRTECYNTGRRPGQRPPEEEGTVVASFECSVPEFAEAVARMVNDINARYTESDFQRTCNPGISPELVDRLSGLTGG